MKDIFDLKTNAIFAAELPVDEITEVFPRQVSEACYSSAATQKSSNPEKVHYSKTFLNDLGIEIKDESSFLNLVSGNTRFNNFTPYAMCYGGHQFGNWAGQLGDGRAINIAEVESNGKNWQLQLKGSGPTPYSRGADGFAVLRSSIREYLCSEAMYHLGIATTRALSLVKTGDLVTRDMLYNGNPQKEQGAIVCRASESFIRFGSFEIFASRQDVKTLTKLVDFVIKHYYSHLGEPNKETYLKFFQEVVDRTKSMIIHWQRVGFVHGVMNTDNMSILGQTIDYGPYGWLEDFNPDWTPNTTDAQNRRYRFGNQPSIGLWNLTQLANAIFPLIDEVEPLQDILRTYKNGFQVDFDLMMMEKIGLKSKEENDQQLLESLQQLMQQSSIDMTLFFRNLSDFEDADAFIAIIQSTSYLTNDEFGEFENQWQQWLSDYGKRLKKETTSTSERKAAMDLVNPKYVLRNYMSQLAIDDAEKGDYKLVDELYTLLLNPYDEQPAMEKWFAKRPDWAKNKVGCSMLSCSS